MLGGTSADEARKDARDARAFRESIAAATVAPPGDSVNMHAAPAQPHPMRASRSTPTLGMRSSFWNSCLSPAKLPSGSATPVHVVHASASQQDAEVTVSAAAVPATKSIASSAPFAKDSMTPREHSLAPVLELASTWESGAQKETSSTPFVLQSPESGFKVLVQPHTRAGVEDPSEAKKGEAQAALKAPKDFVLCSPRSLAFIDENEAPANTGTLPGRNADETRKFASRSPGGTWEDHVPGSHFVVAGKSTGPEHSFKDNLDFMKTEQYGSRAVGGKPPLDPKVYWSIEAVDYLIPDTKSEEKNQREYTPLIRNRRRMFLWFLYTMIAIVTAVVVFFALAVCDYIIKERSYATKKMLKKNKLVWAWVVWTGTSIVLCVASCVMVLYRPAAASSGIPGLIAYLNGVLPPGGKSPITGKGTNFQSVGTLCAKTFGMCLSIPSGLCIGPEGPIIHIGALLGHHTTNAVQTLLRGLLSKEHHLTLKTRAGEDRDFLATGAACGVCVAFRAPLAGVLFIVEEAASFYTTEHLEYTFFACIVAYLVALKITYSGGGESVVDSFTKFKQATGYFCTTYDTVDIFLFVFVAAVGGVLGALFNYLVENFNHWRAHHVNAWGWRRMLEVVLVALVTGSVCVFLPAAFSCEQATRSLMMTDSIGCLKPEDQTEISHGAVSHTVLTELLRANTSGASAFIDAARLNLKYRVDEQDRDAPWKDVTWIDNGHNKDYIKLHYQHSYTCNETDYNGMSMLWLSGGVKGVKVLLQRGVPHMLSAPVLLVFCVVYFLLAAYSSGISVPAGLIVPMLLIGGSYGRATGLLAISLKKALCSSAIVSGGVSNAYYWSTVYRWAARDCGIPDPGMYAVVGMASFLGGSGRITMFLATVMIELTDDATLIFPVGMTAIVSMIVGNYFNHGLYHGLLPVQSLPYLNSEPSDVMWLVNVQDVMSEKVVSLSMHAKIKEIRDLVEKCRSGECSHHAFPVVDCNKTDARLHGIVTLDALSVLADDCERLSGAVVSQIEWVHMLDYCDRSPITVYPTTKVARAFELFRKLGMRHLCVVNNHGVLVGMVTRKDLMTFRLEDNVKRHKAEAMVAGWLVRKNLKNAAAEREKKSVAEKLRKAAAKVAKVGSPRKAPKRSPLRKTFSAPATMTTSRAEGFLAGVPLLRNVKSSERKQLAELTEQRSWADGEAIIEEGSAADALYIVYRGSAVACEASGKVLRYYERSDAFGEHGLVFEDTPSEATVKAVGDTWCLRLGRTAFVSVMGARGEELLTEIEGDKMDNSLGLKSNLSPNAARRKFSDVEPAAQP